MTSPAFKTGNYFNFPAFHDHNHSVPGFNKDDSLNVFVR